MLAAPASKWSIQYTICDEAPQLATYALLPVLRRFIEPFGIRVESPDISLAARILAQFPDKLTPEQRMPDALAALGELTQLPEANIIKLPNISASVPQLNEAIAELQQQGFKVPSYTQNPSTPEEEDAARRYAKVLGSAVNPVLREGNSDRRVAPAVKRNAQKSRPPVRMQPWDPKSRTRVASMTDGDWYANERTAVMDKATSVDITFVGKDGSTRVLKSGLKLLKGEHIDASVMDVARLRAYFASVYEEALRSNLMVSLHLKATMMKVSDPVIFGHAVSVFFADVWKQFGDVFRQHKINPNNGLADVLDKVKKLPGDVRLKVEAAIAQARANGPKLAKVDSDKGITNLHVPNDVIIDASMPPLIRDGGRMWDRDGKLVDTVAMIPDRTYATIYQAVIDDCKANGQFDHSKMGSVANVGLMAQKAEEYGSHDKTFEMSADGRVVVKDASGAVIFDHAVRAGDLWRMCQTKDEPIRDWVRLAVSRARASDTPAIFWLDEDRAHDRGLIGKVRTYLKEHDTKGLHIEIMKPADAMKLSCARARAGKDTISVTGNVLRDYLTDLFPILELGTSAKMLSIVPLLKGGGVFETGAGGSAPKHVEQFQQENHLRWDSLGEYLAVAVSLEHLAAASKSADAKLLAETLNRAVERLLDSGNSPSRKAREIDNRGSTYYVAKYWAEELAAKKPEWKAIAEELRANEAVISKQLLECQGAPVDYGGYYRPDPVKVVRAMRPSPVFNAIIDGAKAKM